MQWTMASNDQQVILKDDESGNGTTEIWPTYMHSPVLNAINTIIACLTLLSNGMVITVMVIRRRVFSSFTNRLILHQSVIDAIAGLLFFFHAVVKSPSDEFFSGSTFYDELFCRVIFSDALLWLAYVASTYNLVFISLERFMATCYPLKHRNAWSTVTGKLKFVVGTSWAIGFICSLHIPFLTEANQGHCEFVELGHAVYIILGVVLASATYFVPIFIIIYTHTRMLIMLTKKLANPVGSTQNTLTKAKRNVLITILLAGTMFVVCWTPAQLYYLVALVFGIAWIESVYIALTGLLACNMCVNPIIYCFKYEHFRVQLKDLLEKRFRRHHIQDEQPISIIRVRTGFDTNSV